MPTRYYRNICTGTSIDNESHHYNINARKLVAHDAVDGFAVFNMIKCLIINLPNNVLAVGYSFIF